MLAGVKYNLNSSHLASTAYSCTRAVRCSTILYDYTLCELVTMYATGSYPGF
jgi:hypothetical protein